MSKRTLLFHGWMATQDRPVSFLVPDCRCKGLYRCGGLVHVLLLREIEHQCEFYRGVL